jgi:hypothetical protein
MFTCRLEFHHMAMIIVDFLYNFDNGVKLWWGGGWLYGVKYCLGKILMHDAMFILTFYLPQVRDIWCSSGMFGWDEITWVSKMHNVRHLV